MAQKEVYFKGEARWAKLHKVDEKYGKHSIEVKLDEASLLQYEGTGLQGRPSKDGEGYYTFRRDPKQLVWRDKVRQAAGKPLVLDSDDRPFSGLIGNGSLCTLKVTVYEYDNSFGKGVGHRLEGVKVDKLVEYQPAMVGVIPPEQGVRVKIPF